MRTGTDRADQLRPSVRVCPYGKKLPDTRRPFRWRQAREDLDASAGVLPCPRSPIHHEEVRDDVSLSQQEVKKLVIDQARAYRSVHTPYRQARGGRVVCAHCVVVWPCQYEAWVRALMGAA